MILDELTRHLEKTEAEYAEMRYQRRQIFSVTVKDGKVENLDKGMISGVCVRTLIDGSWGFSSTTVIDKENIENTINDAISLAKASKTKKKRKVRLVEVEPKIDSYETPMEKDPRREDLTQLLELALEVDEHVRSYSKSIVSDSIRLLIVDDDLAFISSEGARITQRIVRCSGNALVIARAKGNLASTYESIGAQAGLEVYSEDALLKAALKAAERAGRIAPRRVVPGGYHHVILENRIVGLLAHEAVGHCAEADLIHGGSFLADKMGKKVASKMITLIDDGTLPSGYGTMKYDDEGTETKKTVIIEEGTVKHFLHSRETAYQFETEPTGNARAWSFEYDPIIRMRNTYIAPKDQTLEELIEDVRDGYLLRGGGGGQADFNGEFMFGTQEAIKIENGELKESYRGATISGNAFEVLQKVEAVGGDFTLSIGMCGKEQVNFVGIGGPSIRTHILVGGR